MPEKAQPKFLLANGFATGLIPRRIGYRTKNGKIETVEITDEDLTDLLRLFLAPVRPYGCILAHTGGKHKSIMGHYQFFETNLYDLCAALNSTEVKRKYGQHVYIMICGRMKSK